MKHGKSAGIFHLLQYLSAIRIKLIASFFVPVAFIIFLGVVSYSKASEGIRSSFENSTMQAINMTSEYIKFGADSVDNLSIQYVNDDNMNNYIMGLYQRDIIKNDSAYRDLTNSAMAKEVTDDFISNITVL